MVCAHAIIIIFLPGFLIYSNAFQAEGVQLACHTPSYLAQPHVRSRLGRMEFKAMASEINTINNGGRIPGHGSKDHGDGDRNIK